MTNTKLSHAVERLEDAQLAASHALGLLGGKAKKVPSNPRKYPQYLARVRLWWAIAQIEVVKRILLGIQ